MSGHEASAVRRRAGQSLWWAHCGCGWTAPAASKQDAEHRALIHTNVKKAIAIVEASITCDCYDPASMEYYGEGPCPRCRLRDVLGVVA